MSAISKLYEVKKAANEQQADSDNYKAYIADRVENGGWSDADVAEYRAEVERIMKSGTDDEKKAASEFWKEKDKSPARGINDRIRRTMLEAAA